MSGRPASSWVNAMPSAGARAGWTPGCGCEQLWLGWWTTLRASLYRRCPPCRLHKQLQQARCLIEGGEGPGTSKGSAGANPFAGGDEAKGEGPDEDTGEDRSEGTAPGCVSTASSLLRSRKLRSAGSYKKSPETVGARSRNRTGMTLRSADFKSDASTSFAIRACSARRL